MAKPKTHMAALSGEVLTEDDRHEDKVMMELRQLKSHMSKLSKDITRKADTTNFKKAVDGIQKDVLDIRKAAGHVIRFGAKENSSLPEDQINELRRIISNKADLTELRSYTERWRLNQAAAELSIAIDSKVDIPSVDEKVNLAEQRLTQAINRKADLAELKSYVELWQLNELSMQITEEIKKKADSAALNIKADSSDLSVQMLGKLNVSEARMLASELGVAIDSLKALKADASEVQKMSQDMLSKADATALASVILKTDNAMLSTVAASGRIDVLDEKIKALDAKKAGKEDLGFYVSITSLMELEQNVFSSFSALNDRVKKIEDMVKKIESIVIK